MQAIWIILGIYIATMIFIGIRSAKNRPSLTAFVVGNRSAGAWASAFAYGTTYFSAVIFIGYAGRSGWDLGLWAVLIGAGNAFIGAYLAWKVLADPTREVTRRLKIKTMPQLFEQRYGSKGMKIYASVLIFLFMVPYSASVYSGLSYLTETLLGIDYHYAMLGIALIAAVYLVAGGYLASLSADLIQGIVMIFGVIAMILFVVYSPQSGSFSEGLGRMRELMQAEGMTFDNPEISSSVIGLIILTSLGTWGLPQMIHKYYGISDRAAVKRGTVISTVFCTTISCGAYFIGSLSRLFFDRVPELNGAANYDMIVPQMLFGTLPNLLLGITLVLVFSASVSTLSGITLTSCTTVAIDIVQSAFAPEMSKEKTLTLTRALCFFFILLSYIMASFKSPILLLMSFSWGTVAGSFLAPYLLGLYWKGMNQIGAWSGMVAALVTSLTLAISSGFNAGKAPLFGSIAMGVCFAFSILGSLIGRTVCKKRDFTKEYGHFFDKSFTLQTTPEKQ